MEINNKGINILKKIKKRKNLVEWYMKILQNQNNHLVIFKDEFNYEEENNSSIKEMAGIFEKEYPSRILFPTANSSGWWFDENSEFYPENIIYVGTETDLRKWEKLINSAFKELED